MRHLWDRRAIRSTLLITVACVLLPVVAAQTGHEPGSRSTTDAASPAAPVSSPRLAPTGKERALWALKATFGIENLGAGVVSAGWNTYIDDPPEYGPHWDGFAKRYGIRMSGIATSKAMEASLGAVLHEDPRYRYRGGDGLWARVGHAAKLTFMADRPDGRMAPAYARYAAISGSNFVSNSWRAESASGVDDALKRTGFGFSGRFINNMFQEFWPDVRAKVFGK